MAQCSEAEARPSSTARRKAHRATRHGGHRERGGAAGAEERGAAGEEAAALALRLAARRSPARLLAAGRGRELRHRGFVDLVGRPEEAVARDLTPAQRRPARAQWQHAPLLHAQCNKVKSQHGLRAHRNDTSAGLNCTRTCAAITAQTLELRRGGSKHRGTDAHLDVYAERLARRAQLVIDEWPCVLSAWRPRAAPSVSTASLLSGAPDSQRSRLSIHAHASRCARDDADRLPCLNDSRSAMSIRVPGRVLHATRHVAGCTVRATHNCDAA